MNRKRKCERPALISTTENAEVPKYNVIDSQKFVIGRGAETNLQLLFTSISRKHCSLIFDDSRNKWTLLSHSKRTVYVQGKQIKKDDAVVIECGDEIRITPVVSFEFKCDPNPQWQCCADIKKAKLSYIEKGKKFKEELENVIVIDDDDDDPNVIAELIPKQLPDSSSADDFDLYLNPKPSCSGVTLPSQSKIDLPLTVDLKKEISEVPSKEEMIYKFNYTEKLKYFNNTCELYFSDPSENYKLCSTINELSSYFDEENKKSKSDSIDATLMTQTRLAMSFMGKFLQPALYRTPEKSWQESEQKLMKLKVEEKDNLLIQLDTAKEEAEKLKKKNEEMNLKIANYEVMEYEYKILAEAEKFREEEKLDMKKKISTLEDKINSLNYDNSQLLNDICSTADEIAKLKEKCDSLEKKTLPSTSVASSSMYAYGSYGAGFLPSPLPIQYPMPIPPIPMPVIPSFTFAPTPTSSSTSTDKLDSISTMPFEVLRFFFSSTTSAGVALRRSVMEQGVIDMLLGCLAIFTHQQEKINALNPSMKPEVMKILNTIKKAYNTMTTSTMASQVPPSTVPASTASKKKKTAAKSSYYQYWAKGTGYGTGDTTQNWDAEQAMRRKKLEEENISSLLLVIASYINPDPLLNNNFDIIQIGELNFADDEQPVLPVEFIELIERSCLLPVLSSYLRNDSVLDMARHIPLYRAVMVLLRVLAFNSQLVKFFLPQDCRAGSSSSSSLQSSLMEPLEKMKASVDAYSSTLLKNKPGESIQSNNEGEEFNSLIADIQATAIFVEMNTERVISRTVPSTNVPTAASCSTEEIYLRTMKKLQFDSYDMIVENTGATGYKFAVAHHYEKRIRQDGDRSHPARMKRLAQEAVTLTNSLPLSFSSSVFVRTDAERLDVMKVLIIGPAETPYMNGCFEFDVYFPPNYPNVPMLINLETTGRHSVRFNPNLYNEGKVCLSILNTWGGRPEEKWNAQTSSFLQVLVSIQSLILVPDPYFNEPGYERSRGTAAGNRSSREYNANIRQATVEWAMLDQLRNPSPCFKTIIQKHFFLKKKEILSQVNGWLNEAERSGPNNLWSNYLRLKEELAKLEGEGTSGS